MKSQLLEGQKNLLLRQRRLLVGVSLFLGLLVLFLSLSTLFLIGREKTVVVPPLITHPFWVASDVASDSYLEQMADFWTSLLLSANEMNFQVRFGQLLEHTDPDHYSAVKAMLTAQQSLIKERGLSTSFTAQSFQIDKNKQLILIKGALRSMVGNQWVETSEKTFQLAFSIKNGRFYVKRFEEVKT